MSKKHKIIIRDISEGKEKGYMAIIESLNNSLVFGENLRELFEGIEFTFDTAKKDGIGIFRKPSKKVVINKIKLPKNGAVVGG